VNVVTLEVERKLYVTLTCFLFLRTVLNSQRLSRQNCTLARLLHTAFRWREVCDPPKVTSACFQI